MLCRGQCFPYVGNMLTMLVVGCVRSVVPLDLGNCDALFCKYFTASTWLKLMEAYYPSKKCDALDKRAAKYVLPKFLHVGDKLNNTDANVNNMYMLSRNLYLHRLLLHKEGAVMCATQYGYCER